MAAIKKIPGNGSGIFMDDHATLNHLEELAVRLGIKILYETLTVNGSFRIGGYCRIRGEDYLIINRKATVKEKIHLLIDALKRRDLNGIYLMPSLRQILDNPRDREDGQANHEL